MKRILTPLTLLLLLGLAPVARAAANPQVEMKTSKGTMVIELYPAKAPKTVANFLQYVKEHFYDGLIFHRIVPGFVIQGGGFEPGMKQRKTRAPIANEADNGLRNRRYTLSMARTSDPNSATSQFFVNLADNIRLDHRGKTPSGWGYAVFGKVVKGQKVVDAIAALATHNVGPYAGVPTTPVVIKSARKL